MNLPRRSFLLASAMAPLQTVYPQERAAVQELVWTDPRRSRDLPLLVRWPRSFDSGGSPLVVHSHGLGGSRHGGAVWGGAWSRAGFAVVHLQHPGSDTEAVRGAGGLHAAASGAQLLARLQDVRFLLDSLTQRHRTGEPGWRDVRLDAIGVAGHSFGAHTVMGTAGQHYGRQGSLSDPRPRAFIALSPSLPQADAAQALAGVTRPMLCITGTLDDDVVGNGSTPERRRAVFDALPAGRKALLVLAGADHKTFGGNDVSSPRRMGQRPAQSSQLAPAHQALVAAVTTDWWRAELLDDAAARDRLVRPAGLASDDEWRRG